jgi:hypothetical protein
MIKLECSGCKKEFEIQTNEFRQRQRNGSKDIFCSPKCKEDWQRQVFLEKRLPLIEKTRTEIGDKKICSCCGDPKPLEEFHSNKDRLYRYCSECFSKYTSRRYLSRKLALVEFLGGICSVCDKPAHFSAFHFHHTDPSTKEFTWNRLRRKSTKEVIKEIKKCTLICSNCHSETHTSSEIDEEVIRMKDDFLKQLRDLTK